MQGLCCTAAATLPPQVLPATAAATSCTAHTSAPWESTESTIVLNRRRCTPAATTSRAAHRWLHAAYYDGQILTGCWLFFALLFKGLSSLATFLLLCALQASSVNAKK